MAPPTKEMIEMKELSKKFDEMIDGFRGLANRVETNLQHIREINEKINGLALDIAKMKRDKEQKQDYRMSTGR